MPRSLNYELPQAALHFGAYAQQILNQSANNKITTTSTTAVDIPISEAGFGTPTLPSTNNFESVSTTTSNILAGDFLQKLGASLLNSIHLQTFYKPDNLENSFTDNNMDADYGSPHVMLDSSSFEAMDELQKQLQYDKLMNEVWIGIVLTLILISMVFCICSCFLYHQFRTWKRNYQNTVMQSQANDVEAMKLPTDIDDPVPEYTLVSGLPSYEAALELLHKTPKSCLLVYPNILGTFKQQPQIHNLSTTTPTENPTAPETAQHQHASEVTTPLLSMAAPASSVKSNLSTATASGNLPTYSETCDSSSNGLTAVSLVHNYRKVPQHATIAAPSVTATIVAPAATTVTPVTTVHTRNSNAAPHKPNMNYAAAQLVKYDYDKF